MGHYYPRGSGRVIRIVLSCANVRFKFVDRLFAIVSGRAEVTIHITTPRVSEIMLENNVAFRCKKFVGWQDVAGGTPDGIKNRRGEALKRWPHLSPDILNSATFAHKPGLFNGVTPLSHYNDGSQVALTIK
ncbi:hypothetical protein AAG570_012691 [Ranatra chinensis]|uniref:Uncharacterized protein n=1 Tax=Ranatra chinensis TaxID=642074 RepID=A0ABD0YR17_9HEMI